MRWRSRSWWAAALVACAAGVAYSFTLSPGGFAWMGWWGSCPGRELYFSYGSLPWELVAWTPLVQYSGAPLVVLAALGHWASIRWGRPRAGRVSGRAVSVLLLALYGTAPVGFAVDMAFDRACLDGWGGPQGVRGRLLPRRRHHLGLGREILTANSIPLFRDPKPILPGDPSPEPAQVKRDNRPTRP
ncbi:hypothetical protein [Sphaerisporangium rhizosphaerae]|uniref:DUF3995 domain-containing protein n=1 Tax=Sphaerisporangium rhizosphaerae TaxID=2269375 RepID=A0ABW2PDY5_9ACTN